jgi:lysophospholipase L1-like esterase
VTGAAALLIVALGDSVTYGVRPDGAVTAQQTFCAQVEAALRSKNIDASILNRGVPGDNTQRMLARFERDVISHRPNLVLVMAGINDSAWVDAGPRARTSPRVPLAEFARNLQEIVGRVRDSGGRVLLLTPNPISRAYVYSNVGYYSSHDMNEELARYVSAVRETGRQMAVPVADVFADWMTSGMSLDSLLLDGIHPNAEGHRRIAATLLPEVLRLITAKGATSAR